MWLCILQNILACTILTGPYDGSLTAYIIHEVTGAERGVNLSSLFAHLMCGCEPSCRWQKHYHRHISWLPPPGTFSSPLQWSLRDGFNKRVESMEWACGGCFLFCFALKQKCMFIPNTLDHFDASEFFLSFLNSHFQSILPEKRSPPDLKDRFRTNQYNKIKPCVVHSAVPSMAEVLWLCSVSLHWWNSFQLQL